MSFEEEWARLKAETAEQATRTMLNQLAGDGGSPGRLTVRQDDLGAVGHEAYLLHGRLAKDGNTAREATTKAATTLTSHHFTMGAALSSTAETWDSQLRTLLQACAHISNHLDYSAKAYAKEDQDIAATMRAKNGETLGASKINDFFR